MVAGEIEEAGGRGRGITDVDVERGGSGGGVLFEELTAFDEALLALASGDEECDDDGDDCELRVKSRTDSEFDIPGFLLASV